jgi:hypothetical protein
MRTPGKLRSRIVKRLPKRDREGKLIKNPADVVNMDTSW